MNVLVVTLVLHNVRLQYHHQILKMVNVYIFHKLLYQFHHTIFPAIIITGGVPSYRSVEVLRANGSYWCSLPDLPDDRYYHTQSGLVTCGGGSNSDTKTSCLTFSSGQWRTSHQLQHNRWYHSSWMSQHGVVLMGGTGSLTTTEILTEDGQSSPSFTLKYETR